MKALLVLCLATPALCQPAFTVASLKLTEFLPDKRPISTVNPGRIQLTGVTLKNLIARAYSVKEYQVRGPDWISSERYTVAATMPSDTPEPLVWQMLQSLLTERLQLRLRRAPEEMAVYAIVPAKNGPKLERAAGGELSVRIMGGSVTGKNATMQNLGNLLGVMLDRPVIDRTGLEGAFDFALAFTPDTSLGPGMSKMSMEMELTKTEAAGPSIFGALQQQLGLKLEPRKLPVEVLTVETALRVPTEN